MCLLQAVVRQATVPQVGLVPGSDFKASFEGEPTSELETSLKRDVIAVTGSAGYIGSELVSRLKTLSSCQRVVTFDRTAGTTEAPLDNMVDLAEISVEDLASRLEGVDVLFHLAAARTDWGLSYDEYERDNVLVTRKLIAAAQIADVNRWIYYGTVGVYGASSVALDEASPFNPQSDYACTKAQAEEELLRASIENRWSVRVVRPSAVFSEGQPPNTNLYRLIEAIRQNRFVQIGNGEEIKTTSYLHNLVAATLWLYQDLPAGGVEAFNYVDEPKLSTRNMVDLIRLELRCRLPLFRLPLLVVEQPAKVMDVLGHWTGRDFPITAARIRKFCTATNFDSSKIRAAGFQPRYSSEEAIRRTVHWHKALADQISGKALR